MTLRECFENKRLGMKYIGNSNSGERLFKHECLLNVNIFKIKKKCIYHLHQVLAERNFYITLSIILTKREGVLDYKLNLIPSELCCSLELQIMLNTLHNQIHSKIN